MSVVVLSTVTVGDVWEELDESTQNALNPKRAKLPDVSISTPERTRQTPATSQLAALGIYDIARGAGVIYVNSADEHAVCDTDDVYRYRYVSEKEMLEQFWTGIREYRAVVSYTGRSHVLPFVMHRSMYHGIRPTATLLGARRVVQQVEPFHVDLQDEFTWYGTMHKHTNLTLWCRLYGVPYEGLWVAPETIQGWCAEQNYTKLAEYARTRVHAITSLYSIWCEYFAPPGWSGHT